jgi:DNA-binding CsgD family transcriptional regulator
MPWRSVAARAYAELGNREAARALVDEELALARRFGAAPALGVALRAHGLLTGDLDELRESVDVLSRSQARLEHAHSLVELGAALRRAGQRREARDMLRHGHELAQSCGADALVARAAEELSASGARLVSRPVSGLDALTPSERRVASLAAQGLTNPQIAQSLFLSLKTVEMHLGRTYRKLGIANRAELAGRLGAPAHPPPEPLAEPA